MVATLPRRVAAIIPVRSFNYNNNDNTGNQCPDNPDVLYKWQKGKSKMYYYSVSWGGVNPNDASIIFQRNDGSYEYTGSDDHY